MDNIRELHSFHMSEEIRERMSAFIESTFGIRMPAAKKTLLEGRLSKRLRALHLSSFEAYYEFLMSEHGQEEEMIHFSDLVSTHKTDFFREKSHFDYLLATVLPGLHKDGAGTKRTLNVWSAAASTGEEVYTLAMVIDDFFIKNGIPNPQFSVLGTDISEHALHKALRAVYNERLAEPIPVEYRQRYLTRGTGEHEGLVRITPALRAHTRFRALNLMEDSYDLTESMDIIFLRNVLIYFEKPTQERIIQHLRASLSDDGWFFIGHSESIFGFHTGLTPVIPTVFRRGNG
ncbi:MAG: chemotaxis protein CheR [Spirochaetes bacterium]|nr:chemotaxis protein CheR [Spirochaetota bacterium]